MPVSTMWIFQLFVGCRGDDPSGGDINAKTSPVVMVAIWPPLSILPPLLQGMVFLLGVVPDEDLTDQRVDPGRGQLLEGEKPGGLPLLDDVERPERGDVGDEEPVAQDRPPELGVTVHLPEQPTLRQVDAELLGDFPTKGGLGG